ncbi:MAG: aminodeoxychorismate synthase component I [Ignavibacteriaceae bacterium]
MKIDFILEQILTVKNSAFFYTPALYKKSNSFIFYEPYKILSINDLKEFSLKQGMVDKYFQDGAAGYSIIKYEAGYMFEKKLLNLTDDRDKDLIKFCFFKEENVRKIKSDNIEIGAFKKKYELSSFKLNTTQNEFIKNVKKIKNYIAAGDTYQVNYTVKGFFDFSGDLYSLFKALIFNQSARYIGFINNGDEIIISVSPELFFHYKKGKILSRPMKGTLKRSVSVLSDYMQKQKLGQDEKNNSENLMIIDLLRNDLGKFCEPGKVNTKSMFDIETYESLHQMVSAITGKLKPDISFSDIIKSLFPCGSITGAPKIRTMEIIKILEKENRGIYTGAIGLIKKDEIIFNVAIRTIVLKNKVRGELGLGSGIVWDSDPVQEYEEVILKSNFILKPHPYFELFETMLIENKRVFLLKEHLERIKSSADYFLFKYDGNKIVKKINKALEKIQHHEKFRLKLFLNKWGKVKIQIDAFPENSEEIKVIIAEKKTYPDDPFLYHKTTNRQLYEKEYSFHFSEGFFDILFFNRKNELTEGAISNVFIKKSETWYTPPVSCGLLPGIYRNYFLKRNNKVKEKIISFEDVMLADEILLTNSLRKKIKVNKLFINSKEFREF